VVSLLSKDFFALLGERFLLDIPGVDEKLFTMGFYKKRKMLHGNFGEDE
jgi:hypothetical protein